MMKRIQTLEDGTVPAKEAKNWRTEREKKRITRKEYKNLAKETGEGYVVRESKAMHEEDFWSSWLGEDETSEEERRAEAEGKEEEEEKRKREAEKEENETGTVER